MPTPRAIPRHALSSVLWIALPVAAAQLEPLREVLPVLGLFGGWLGPSLLAGALAVVLATAYLPGPSWPRPGVAVLLILPTLVYAGMGLSWIRHVEATGDEPEYLLMAQSLWQDGDLDLQNNWEERDFEAYVSGMPRAPFGTFRADGRPFPARSPGLPFAVAPVLALGGRAACVILLGALCSVLALIVRSLALGLTGDEDAARLAWLASLGPPAAFMTFQIYPALLAAVAVALCLWVLLGEPRPWSAAVAGLAASTLPWLHTRLIGVAVALGIVALARLRGRALLAFLAAVAAMALAFFAYNSAVFGAVSPLGPYGGKLPRGIRQSAPLRAAPGIFLDRSFGLLPYAPVFALALVPAWRLRARVWPLLVVALGLLAPVVTWRAWFGGFSPPARFLVPLVPVLGALLALRLAEPRRGLARWTGPLLAAGFALAAVLCWPPAEMRVLNVKHEAPYGLSWLSDPEVAGRYLPNFTSRDPSDERVCVAWVAAALLLLGLDVAARRRPEVDRLFRTPALPVLLLLAVGVAVDVWASG
jgi:hypothetical protein